MIKFKKFLIPFIAVLCIGIIVFLVLFSNDMLEKSEQFTTEALKSYSITFDSDELVCNGSINFMQGVTATDENGVDLTEYVTVSCTPTKEMNKKVLTYSINKAGYRIDSFERKLLLDFDYNGPSIKIVENSVEVPIDQVNNLTLLVEQANIIATDDGFGNSCGIAVQLETSQVELGDYIATVTASNIFGDSVSAKLNITITQAEHSIIKLSASSVTLNVGDSFDASAYVVSANDSDLGNLIGNVVYNSDVDTSKPGTYTVEYFVKGVMEHENDKAYLTVTVK